MEAAAALEVPLRTLKAFRQPSVHIQRVAQVRLPRCHCRSHFSSFVIPEESVTRACSQVLLLLLGKGRGPSEFGVWRWEDVRAGLRDRHLLPLLAAFDPRRVDEATAAAASSTLASLSVERIARVSEAVAKVFRWCADQLERVEAALDGAPSAGTRAAVEQAGSGEEDEYADEDFDEDSERQIGDEENASDRALWRRQQASTVLAGDFDYSILDGAMISMVVKFLGAGHNAILLQTKALEALIARLQSAPLEAVEKAGGDSNDEDDDEVETLGEVMRGICECGGVQRCISLLGAGSLATRMRAAQLLATLVRHSPEAAELFKSCGGELADEAGCFDALEWTEDRDSKPFELSAATTVLSGEGAAGRWGLDLEGDTVVANSAFVSDHGEGVLLAEGMVCVGIVEGGRRSKAAAGHPVQGAHIVATAERLSSGLDLWNGRRLCLLRWERSLLMPPGEEDSSEDSILWRSQVAQTVQEGAFAWEALDEAMLGSVIKYLGSGVLVVQAQAAAALRRRLGNEEQNGGKHMAAVAAQIVSGGGLHRLVDWLGSEEPGLRDEGARTLRLLVARSTPEAMQDAVVALAVKLGGQTVLELLDQKMIPAEQNDRGYTTINVGITGAQTLWGLRVSRDGAVRSVAAGSVAATSLVRPKGLRLISISGYPAAAYRGSIRDALEAAAAGVLAVENSWKGTRLLQLVVHQVDWISNHLSQDVCTRRTEMWCADYYPRLS